MKKIFILLIYSILLCGCSNKNDSVIDSANIETESTVENNEKTNNDIKNKTYKSVETINGYERAEFDKFNSYASENGLGGTPVYIEGTIVSRVLVMDTIGIIVKDSNSEHDEEWVLDVGKNYSYDNIDKYIGQKIRAFGIYVGFSDVVKRPGISLAGNDKEDTEKYFEIISEDGKELERVCITNQEKIGEQQEEMTKDYDKNNENEAGESIENNEIGTLVYDDERVKIYFIGIGTKGAIFDVENFTEANITIQADTVSINGNSYNDILMSDDVAPKSKGRVVAEFSIDASTKVDTIGGQLRVIDFEKSFKTYNAKFINIATD